MPTITFVDDSITEDVEVGQTLQEIIEDCGADIIFGCREGGCATCIIDVLEGMECLSPISEAEEHTLEEDELAQNKRLACQIHLVKDGTISLRQAGL